MRLVRCAAAVGAAFGLAAPAAAQTSAANTGGTGWLAPPVDAPIARPYSQPAGPFAAGHRGIDYATPAGTLVRSAGAGRVTFAGPVANVVAVTIDHGDGLTTTYTSLASTLVAATDDVNEGQWIGRAGVPHVGGAPGLHFGVRVDGSYVDPLTYLGPVGVAGAVHLAPLPGSRTPAPSWKLPEVVDELARRSPCRVPALLHDPPPPNDNVLVVVAGLGTRTATGEAPPVYDDLPELLGYPRASVYRFSYAGAHGPGLHEPYEPTHTYADLTAAARRLRELLLRVARRSPARSVDLIAHSQGGVVARAYLESLHRAWDPRLPVIDSLVTLATPHEGAPLAAAARSLAEDSISGRALLRWMSSRARSGSVWPDPLSPAVQQLSPGSELVESLATEDVSYGTRVLALAAANDAVVPADRALFRNELSRVVAPVGLNDHSAVVTAPESVAAAYAFLRGARPPCRTQWDRWGPRRGRALGWLEEAVPWLYARLEGAILRGALVGRLGWLLGRKG